MPNAEFGPGRIHYVDRIEGHDRAFIWVPVSLDGFKTYAMVDTGAQFTVIAWEIAQQLGLSGNGESLNYSTREGLFKGELVRHNLELRSEPGGESQSLVVEATIWVSEQWRGPSILGYIGFLEKIRFAVDPSPGEQLFLFGACA